MTTIYDIAKVTGISKSTVSRVVSGKDYVSAEKRQVILQAMHDLHYVPNQTAQNLRGQQTHTIGFLVSHYFPLVGEFMDAFVKIASQYGYAVNVYFTQDKKHELSALNLLTTKALDAIFIMTRLNPWNLIASYTNFGPIATWQRLDRAEIYSSYIDHYPIYLQILKRLYAKGYRHVGHVLSLPRNANTQARLQAIRHFEPIHPEMYHKPQLFYRSQLRAGANAAAYWLQSEDRPEAMIFFADYVAAEFIMTLRQHQIAVPQKCMVVSTDNSEISRLMAIPTVDLRFREQAQNAFIYLYNQLNGEQKPYLSLQPRWISRGKFPHKK